MRTFALLGFFIRVEAGYDEARALEFVKLAGAAYCSASSLESWSCGSKCSADVKSVKVCKGSTTQSFVGLWEGTCVVSFEGTSNIQSFLKDLEFLKEATNWDGCNNCKVHGGFLDEYKSHQGCVKDALNSLGCGKGSKIRTTGHSLGASLNSIAMMDLTADGWKIEESYDFGKPRTGDANFAKAYDNLFNGKAWRVTHAKDPVPQVPPDQLIVDWEFQHTEPEVYYKGEVSDGHQECTKAHDDTACAEQYWNVPIDLLHIADHLDYMGIDTSIFGCSNGIEDIVA
jgi:hypothetical protein